MYSSAELIEAMQRRMRRSLRPLPPPGKYPASWQAWFATMRGREGKVTGASSEAIVALLVQREPSLPPRRLAELNRWQAFGTLWRQQWEPAEGASRRQRVAAYAITIVTHMLLAVLLLWLGEMRVDGMPAAPGEQIVQVEFIGEGTPREQGGGAPAADVAEPVAATPSKATQSKPVSRTPQAAAATAPTRAELTQVPPLSQPRQPPSQPTPPRPAPPSEPRAQPLEVTQTNQPDSSFVLAPTTPRTVAIAQPQIVVPELSASAEALEAVDIPAPAPVEQVRPDLPTARITVPDIKVQAEALPQPQPSMQAVRPREVETPQARLRAPTLKDAIADLPTPDTSAAVAGQAAADAAADAAEKQSADNVAQGKGTGRQPAADALKPGGPPAAVSGTAGNPATAGAGPEKAAKPGAWSTPKAGDDWGLSDRNRPGGQSGKQGLFDKNGRPRLPPGNRAEAGGGLPPGIVEGKIDNLDRSGTWLKRPPIDFSPTRFDQYWIPGGTLLQEWVRRGIKKISIPIPGTSKKLNCVVSILQAGGGCGIDDPNMQDQEAIARPPPDIPFKPELQENQDALRQPTTPP